VSHRPDPSRIGALVGGKYRIVRFLAEGGMGAVYEAQHEVVKRRFAVKFLHPDLSGRRDILTRFEREARAAGALESENVAAAIDFGITTEGTPYIVMEYLVGEDLASLLGREGILPIERATDLCLQACRGMEVAHAAGIIHRDLKPQNLFVCRRNEGTDLLKVLDFGVAKLQAIDEGSGATRAGTVLGTVSYMSPEQARGDKVIDRRSDVYSIGAILYQLVSGSTPHPGESNNAILHHIFTCRPVPLAGVRPGLPAPLVQIVERALSSDPRARHASVEALGKELAPWARSEVWPEARPETHGAPTRSSPVLTATAPPPAAPGGRTGQTGPSEVYGLVALPFPIDAGAPAATGSGASSPPSTTGRRALLLAVVLLAVSLGGMVGPGRSCMTRFTESSICGLPNAGATRTCGACMTNACCTQAQACVGIDGCPRIEACVRACASGEAACRAQCYADMGPGAQHQQELETCRATACASQCLPGPWACLGHVRPYSPGPIPPKIVIKTTVVCVGCGTGGGPAPIAGTAARVCSLADPQCDLPLAHGISDDSGAVTLNVDTSLYPPPLVVFLELRKEGFLDTLLQEFSAPPLSADVDLGQIPLLEQGRNTGAAATSFGTTYDPTRGDVGVRPRDCNGQPASKKTTMTWLDRDDETTSVAYFNYGLGPHAFNLPINAAGITRLVARVAETNQLIATANVVIRPRAASLVSMSPTP
jgi:serine/threonine protein kinase